MTKTYSDYVRRFYTEDSEGACVTIQNDGDGLGLVEVRTVSPKDVEYFGTLNFSMDVSAMRDFAQLLIESANAIEKISD